MPTLGCRLPIIGSIKTTMYAEKTTIGRDKVISFEEIAKEKGFKESLSSQFNVEVVVPETVVSHGPAQTKLL